MFQKLIDKAFGSAYETGDIPNKFTVAVGQLIREARKDAKMSQAELARLIYKRQATVSDMENGKVEPIASTLLLLSYALNKPVGYFFPRNQGIVELYAGDLTAEEQELIFQSRRIVNYSDEAELKKVIAQVKALADLAEAKALEDFRKQSKASQSEIEE